jgi:predicted TIM-barrel fold metal-dependent hydrolase
VADPVASLTDPALDRILDFAGEAGLVVLLHNDLDRPFAKESDTGPHSQNGPAYLDEMKALFRRHPGTTIIWAHTGVGRVVRPIKNHAANLMKILADPQFGNVYFDISWDEVAKYIVATPESTRITADMINRYPDRFLFGTDEVAPPNKSEYTKIYYEYGPLWKLLDPETSKKVRLTNYERIFDQARRNVRAWEAHHVNRP